LGATNARLIRQIVAEGFVISILGGLAALVVAQWGVSFLKAEAPENLLGGLNPITLDLRAITFMFGAVLTCTAISGLPPAWNIFRGRLQESLAGTTRSVTASHHMLRTSLVVSEVAVGLVLLVGSGLLVHSFLRLLAVDPGFDAHNVVTISTQSPPTAKTAEQLTSIYALMRDRILSTPGVVSVGVVSRLPLMGSNLGSTLVVEGKSIPGQQGPDVEYRVATPSYFPTMGIALKRGRAFDEPTILNRYL
jgi:cell division protein FtsX